MKYNLNKKYPLLLAKMTNVTVKHLVLAKNDHIHIYIYMSEKDSKLYKQIQKILIFFSKKKKKKKPFCKGCFNNYKTII